MWWQSYKGKILNNKILVTNFSYLALLQIFVMISPLITYPYLIRVIGLELNGVIVFAQSISTYLSLIINFGFNIYGVRQVAIYKKNQLELDKIVSTIYTSKIFIWFFLLLGWLLLISKLAFFSQYYWAYFFSFFITLNELLFPVWLFQGLERMKYISIVNITTRLVFILLIFLIIKDKMDYYIVPLLNSIGALIAGLLSLWIVFVKLGFKYRVPSKNTMMTYFKEGFPLFVSFISIQIYANINKLLVGGFLGMTDVSLYDFCEKIIALVRIPVSIIQQTVFPKISREKNVSFVNQVLKIVLILNILLCLGVLLLSPFIMNYMLGHVFKIGILIMAIMSGSTIVSGINLFLCGCRLLPWDIRCNYSRIAVLNSFFFITLVAYLYLSDNISLYTIPILSFLTEIFSLYLLYRQNKKVGLLYGISS